MTDTNRIVRGALAAAAMIALSTSAVLAQGGSSAFPTPGQPVPQNNGTSSSNGNATTPGDTTIHHRHHHYHHVTQTSATTDTTTPPPDQSGAPH
jgi:hypothetical protein